MTTIPTDAELPAVLPEARGEGEGLRVPHQDAHQGQDQRAIDGSRSRSAPE